MAASKLMMVVVVMAIASFRLPSAVAQTRYVVGDAFGWMIPTANGVNYTTWASQQTFNVGDTLLFNFTTRAHDVAEVTQSAYGPCNTANPIYTIFEGPATITLNTTGNHYYICTFGTHCQAGQKLAINVAGGSPAPAGSTPPPPPPAPSSASSFTAVVPITFLMAALAMFH